MKTTVERFAQWWWQGLSAPWPTRHEPRRFIAISDAGWALRENIHDDGSLSKLSELEDQSIHWQDSKNYLLVDNKNAITTRIPEAKRGESLAQISEALLPFESKEIYFQVNDAKSELYAVVRTELKDAISHLGSADIQTNGIAFLGDEEFIPLDLDLPSSEQNKAQEKSNTNKSSIPKSVSKPLVFAALFITISLFTYGGLRFFESQEQQKLTEQLKGLNTSLEVEAPDYAAIEQELSLVAKNRIINPGLILSKVSQTLPDNAQINQLILNQDEIIIDGEASKASGVQTALEELEVFGESQFISAISADQKNQTERFKLKLTVGGKE